MIPNLRFNDKVGNDYPDWEVSYLGELCSITTGKLDANAQVTDGKYLFFTCAKKVFRIDEYAFEGASLLISGNGANVGYIHNYEGRFNAYQRTYVLQNIEVNRDYLQYYLEQNLQRRIHREKKDGNTPYIVMTTLTKMEIRLPSTEEQDKIAIALKSVDQKINLLTKKKEALETYKKGLMQKIFSQELRFKREDGTDYPEWEIKKGDELFSNISDKHHNGDLPILAITQNYGAIPREMIDYDISVEDKSIMSYKIVERGDFIISLRSFQGGIEYSDYRGICSPAYIILRSNQVIESRFFKAYFKTHNLIQQINSKLEGIRDGKMLSYKYFSELHLPYPSIEEQQHIGNLLSAIDEKLSSTQKLLDENTKMKKGLLQQMFV